MTIDGKTNISDHRLCWMMIFCRWELCGYSCFGNHSLVSANRVFVKRCAKLMISLLSAYFFFQLSGCPRKTRWPCLPNQIRRMPREHFGQSASFILAQLFTIVVTWHRRCQKWHQMRWFSWCKKNSEIIVGWWWWWCCQLFIQHSDGCCCFVRILLHFFSFDCHCFVMIAIRYVILGRGSINMGGLAQ